MKFSIAAEQLFERRRLFSFRVQCAVVSTDFERRPM